MHVKQNPLEFQNHPIENLKADIPAGLVVFLVALPLCLGIALASGAPLFSGLIAGIVGGVLVGMLSGSEVSVSGPAAGLAVIVASSIQKLGAFETFLAVVVLAGIFQVIFGMLKFGGIGDFVPVCVIKGMLAAIGIVIILKQIPHALGRDDDYIGDFEFLQKVNGDNTFGAIIHSVFSLNGEAVIITVVSLVILLTWELPWVKKNALLRYIPGPLLVVAIGIALNESFRVFFQNFYLKAEDGHLVQLPVSTGMSSFIGHFTFPSLSAFANHKVYLAAVTIAVVGSLETLLSVEASEKIDPYKRIADTNRELLAQGVGNIASGLVGGLPITSVVVRTSANVAAGGRTRLSSIVHGALLLIAVLLVPTLLNRIPLACLAAILLMVGYKLAQVKLFKDMYRQGGEQFIPFIITILAIVFTDLLMGIGIGMIFGLFFVIRANHHAALTVVNQENYYLLRFNKDMSFFNKAALKEHLLEIPNNVHLIIDGTKAMYIDHDIYEVIEEFQAAAKHRNITVETKNLFYKTPPPPRWARFGRSNGIVQETVVGK